MMKTFKTILAAAMISLMAAAAYADTNIYPLPAVFISKNINNPKFENLFKNQKNYFITKFIENFYKTFPAPVSSINDKNKYNTFVAYINLPRVSENYFDKGELTDIYMPLTASLNFVNMTTSEILYSESLTKYAKYKTTKSVLKSDTSNTVFEDLYKKTYDDVTKDIIKAAGQNFKPYGITTAIKDKYKSIYVLDKGLTHGIAKGDLLTDSENNQLSVIYSDLDYSLATSIFGNLKKNTLFSKFTNSGLMQLKKPKVLFINDFENEKIYNLFAAALGSNADFSLITVDKSFYDMQTAVVSLNTGFKNQNIQNREIPDYFFKLYFTKPLFAVYPTNKTFYNINKYGMFVCGNIFDKQGQVVYASCVNDEINDDVISDMKFSDEAQFEIVTKNAFAKLAQDIAAGLKFKTAKIEIDKVKDNTIELKDINHILNFNDNVTVLKRVKTDDGSDIVIPTWIYRVIAINGNNVTCEMVSSIADELPNPSARDSVTILSASSASKIKTNAYDFVTGQSELSGNEVKLKYFDMIAFNAISSKINLPVSVNKIKLDEQIEELNRGYGFKKKIKPVITQSDNKITVKYKIQLISEERNQNLIDKKYRIICGVILNSGNADPIKSGLVQEVTISIPPDKNDDVIEYELLKHIYTLVQSIAEELSSKTK